ncbi:MAG: SPOR domain-containing protein, partial [Deltaproteobacteria bacterium]
KRLLTEVTMAILAFLVIGCSLSEQNATKTAPIGFITTPASYYSSAKARYLGTKYKENLDRLAERIVRNPKTARLQFANNIASVGGIGFFTHSATSTADERFLEVIVSAPETFESKGDLNAKVLSVFSAYGPELLFILAADSDIYQEKEVSGYGLNFMWRSLVPDSKGTRVVLERAVIYIPKDKVRGFLHQEVDQNKFLADAIIFTATDSGPMNLVSYRLPDPRLDTRLPIREESLAASQTEKSVEPRRSLGSQREMGKETLPPSAAAGDSRSKGVALDPSMEVAKQQPLEGTPLDQVPANKPTDAAKENSAAGQQRGDGSRDRPPEATNRSDHAVMAEEPIGQPRSVASKMQEMSTAEPRNITKIPEKNLVTKRLDEPSELKKADARASTSPIPKVDHDREAKSTSDGRRFDSVSMPAPEKTGRGGETAEATVANSTESQGNNGGNLASGTSPSTPKPPVDKRTTAAPKSAPDAKSLIAEGQPKVDKKAAPFTGDQLPVPVTSSPAGGGLEPELPAGTVPPAQQNQLEIAKATPDLLAKSMARSDPQQGATAGATPPSPDTSNSISVKNRDVAVAANSQVKAPGAPAVLSAQSSEGLNLSDKETNDRIALQKDKTSEIMPKREAGVGAASKALEGYIIQVVFKNRGDAQRWAETMARRGYAISVTEAGGTESVRVRLGNFSVREEADRQLMSMKQQGLSGIVINLPQAYRPDTRAPASKKSETQSAQAHD